MVGQSENSLMPWRTSGSESTSKVSNGTARALRIWQTLLEKPHWGISLFPFINTTTGLLATRVSMRWRVLGSMEMVGRNGYY